MVNEPAIITVDKLKETAQEKAAWRHLYNQYAAFYGEPMTDALADTTWCWLHDPNHVVDGMVAKSGAGELIGLVHFRPVPRPLNADYVGFIDDLFVDPVYRGKGIATLLIHKVVELAHQNKWTCVQWITAENNHSARSLYDRLATETNWVTYEILAEQSPI